MQQPSCEQRDDAKGAQSFLRRLSAALPRRSDGGNRATLRQRAADIRALMVRIDDRLLLLPAAYMLVLGAILLTNSTDAATFSYVAVLVPIATLTILPFARQTLLTSRIFWAVGTYLLAIAVASILNPDIPNWLLNRIPRMSPMVLYFVIITAFLTVRSRLGFTNFMLLCIAVLVASALINIGWFLATRSFSPEAPDEFRLLGNLGMPLTRNATNLSITYAIYCAAAVAMIFDEVALWRRILFGFFGLSLLIGVLMTQSRSAYIALLLSVMLLASSLRRPARMALVGCLAITVFVLLLLLVPPARQVIDARGFSHRPEIWLRYFAMAEHRPFFGYGVSPTIAQVISDGLVVDQAHNIVLSALVRGGLFGCVAMMAMLTQSIYWGYRFWATIRRIAPLCMLVAMTTASMFDYELLASNPSWEWVTFWLPIGVAVGLEMSGRSETAERSQGTPADENKPWLISFSAAVETSPLTSSSASSRKRS